MKKARGQKTKVKKRRERIVRFVLLALAGLAHPPALAQAQGLDRYRVIWEKNAFAPHRPASAAPMSRKSASAPSNGKTGPVTEFDEVALVGIYLAEDGSYRAILSDRSGRVQSYALGALVQGYEIVKIEFEKGCVWVRKQGTARGKRPGPVRLELGKTVQGRELGTRHPEKPRSVAAATPGYRAAEKPARPLPKLSRSRSDEIKRRMRLRKLRLRSKKR